MYTYRVRTPMELSLALYELCESADLHDFSGDNIWTLLTTPEYLMHYAQLLPEEEQEVQEPVEVQTAQESGMSAVTAVLVVAVPLVLAVVIWLLFRRRSR